MTPVFTYLAFYGELRKEFEAPTAYAAMQLAEAHFKPPKSKRWMLSVHLVKKDGKDVEQSTDF